MTFLLFVYLVFSRLFGLIAASTSDSDQFFSDLTDRRIDNMFQKIPIALVIEYFFILRIYENLGSVFGRGDKNDY